MDHLRRLCLLVFLFSSCAHTVKPFKPRRITGINYIAEQVSSNQWLIYTKPGDLEAKALALRDLKLGVHVSDDYDLTVIQTLQK